MRRLPLPTILGILVASISLPVETIAAQASPAPQGQASVQANTAGQTRAAAQAPVTPSASAGAPQSVEPASLLGSTLQRVIELFGSPRTVHAVRGPEAWQDDVVFVYDGLELYWFRDRVWQVRADAAFGIAMRDSRETVVSLLGEPLHRLDGAFVYQLPSHAWPLRLSVAFDADGRVAKLYVYRADF